MKPKKCLFARKSVPYLGHVVSAEGIRPNPEKLQGIRDFPVPTSVSTLKSFIGTCSYYRRFIKDFATLASPLNKLLLKESKFLWSDECQESFELLKEKLCSPPVLIHHEFSQLFYLETDASGTGISAILSQVPRGGTYPNTTMPLPVAYASRALGKTERRYHTTEREALACYWGIQYFRSYLYGRHFVVKTDHCPNTALLNTKSTSSRMQKWALKLQDHNFTVEYRSGASNRNADGLSRAYEDSYKPTKMVLATDVTFFPPNFERE